MIHVRKRLNFLRPFQNSCREASHYFSLVRALPKSEKLPNTYRTGRCTVTFRRDLRQWPETVLCLCPGTCFLLKCTHLHAIGSFAGLRSRLNVALHCCLAQLRYYSVLYSPFLLYTYIPNYKHPLIHVDHHRSLGSSLTRRFIPSH
jgi:hypothetical protein